MHFRFPRLHLVTFRLSPAKRGMTLFYAHWAFGQRPVCGIDILGRFPPFSIPFQSGVGEGAPWEIAWPLHFTFVPSPGAKDNIACGLLNSIKQCWPRAQGRVWGEKERADLVLGVLMRMLKRRNKHSGRSCSEPYSLFSRNMFELFQAYLSACGYQITISLKLLLSTRPSPFYISQTSCQTFEDPMVMPPFCPASRVVLSLSGLCSCCPLCPDGFPLDPPVVGCRSGLGVSLSVIPKVGPLALHHSRNHTEMVMCSPSGFWLCPWHLVSASKQEDLRMCSKKK